MKYLQYLIKLKIKYAHFLLKFDQINKAIENYEDAFM